MPWGAQRKRRFAAGSSAAPRSARSRSDLPRFSRRRFPRKSRAGEKRKQLPGQGQIQQGKGKQRGSLLTFVCCSHLFAAEAQRNKSLCFSTQYCLKRNTRAAATTAGEQGEAATTAPANEGGKRENTAAGAHAAACVLVLTAEAGIFSACGEH